MTPEEIDVDVSHGSPVEQINFSQLKAKLNGVIHCIGKIPIVRYSLDAPFL